MIKIFRSSLFKFFIFIALFIVLMIFYSKYIGVNGLEVREYRIESNVLSENFSGLKAVHFSDLLYGSTIDMNDVSELVSKINILKPDIVLFTGDLISNGYSISNNEKNELSKHLSNINASIGKYAIYGDVDYNFKSYDVIMNSSSFTMLNNSYEEIYYKNNDYMYIVGIPSSIKDKAKLDESFEFYKDENRKYTIVMVHDGNSIKTLNNSTYEVDLIVGGHSLNGSVKLPFIGGLFNPKECYKYCDEYYEKGITNIYISGGLGTLEHDYRLFNKPSFNLYRLKAQS